MVTQRRSIRPQSKGLLFLELIVVYDVLRFTRHLEPRMVPTTVARWKGFTAYNRYFMSRMMPVMRDSINARDFAFFSRLELLAQVDSHV
jgi:hypothetical protein